MNITVLGCGRWGSFLAWYHSRNGDVMLYGRSGSQSFEQLHSTRKNEYVTLTNNIKTTDDLKTAVLFSDIIILAISAQHLRSFAKRLNELDISGKTFILCMKGLEANTGKRLSEVLKSEVHQNIHVAVWVGPGHVQDFIKGIPNCQVVDSDEEDVVDEIVSSMSTDLIRLYKGSDIVGTELGAAAKNVVGIAAGMLDGKNLSSLKGALMARGAREIARLMHAMGANELSAYGLCHLGDYEATLFSSHSHNRSFGESFIKSEQFTVLAEGVETVKALVILGKRYGVELPICGAVNKIIHEQQNSDEVLQELFARSVKKEFDLYY